MDEKIMLPEAFLLRMREYLKEEYETFLASYEDSPKRGLRINPRKADPSLMEKLPFALTPVPWEKNGFYYDKESRPGKHPLHEAGAYYLQEPSAMLPATLLAPERGEVVLDLCAAPGGKTTQLGAAMEGKGLLMANEIHPARAKILSENAERMGLSNCIVLNESPDRLSRRFPFFFDRILVDAPCSGEGMFRKNPEAVSEWSPENVKVSAARQREILECAAGMLRPGGKLCYSTCTFSPEEDEEQVSRFLSAHPDFTLLQTEKLMPHRAAGEGQFAALLQLAGECAPRGESLPQKKKPLPPELKELLTVSLGETGLLSFGDQLYLLPEYAPDLSGLKVLRPGLHLGSYKKNRFEPAHALAMALRPEEVRSSLPLSYEEAVSYLAGNAIRREAPKGWILLTLEGSSLGFAKSDGTILKNHYPKGLRRQLSLPEERGG